MLFRAVTHRPLLDSGDLSILGEKQLKQLHEWGPKDLLEAFAYAQASLIQDKICCVDRLVVCELLAWGLQREPNKRLQSAEEMLEHPYFSLNSRAS